MMKIYTLKRFDTVLLKFTVVENLADPVVRIVCSMKIVSVYRRLIWSLMKTGCRVGI